MNTNDTVSLLPTLKEVNAELLRLHGAWTDYSVGIVLQAVRNLVDAAPVPAAPADEQPKLVLALPNYEQRRIVVASDEMIDGERLVCVAIKDAAAPADKGELPEPDHRIEKLDKSKFRWIDYYTAESVRACILADRTRQAAIAQPSGYATVDHRGSVVSHNLPEGRHELFAAPQPPSTGSISDDAEFEAIFKYMLRDEYHALVKLIDTRTAALIDAASKERGDAARDVLAERQRQVNVEGWTSERDDNYTNCELARAAATYAVCSHVEQLQICGKRAWPWHADWFKRTTYRRDLVKAGALLLAEIERLDRDSAAIATTKAAK